MRAERPTPTACKGGFFHIKMEDYKWLFSIPQLTFFRPS